MACIYKMVVKKRIRKTKKKRVKIDSVKKKIQRKSPPTRKARGGKLIRKDIQDLKGEIQKLGIKVERKKTGPLDSGVGVLVDANFNDFLTEIKTSLSDRIKAREEMLEKTLKEDLKKRENSFKDKRLGLIREFNDKKRKLREQVDKKYSLKVQASLQKEINEKFNRKLQESLDTEKSKLSKRYKIQLREHVEEGIKKKKQHLEEKLHNELSKKLKDLERQFEKEESMKLKEEGERLKKLESGEILLGKSKESFKKQKEREMEELKKEVKRSKESFKKEKEKEMEKLRKKANKSEEIFKRARENFDLEKKKKMEEIALLNEKIKIKENQEIEKMRKGRIFLEEAKKLVNERNEKKIKNLNYEIAKTELQLRKAKQDFILQKKEVRKNIREKLVDEFHKKLDNELSEKEKIIRKQLRNEFELRLEKEERKHEKEMEDKKIDLELAMQEKMKEVLSLK